MQAEDANTHRPAVSSERPLVFQPGTCITFGGIIYYKSVFMPDALFSRRRGCFLLFFFFLFALPRQEQSPAQRRQEMRCRLCKTPY